MIQTRDRLGTDSTLTRETHEKDTRERRKRETQERHDESDMKKKTDRI